MIAAGDVAVNGHVITDQKARVSAGDEITLTLPELVESHILPQDIPLDIVFEDAHLIVLNKPTGMVVHPAPGTPDGTLVNALLHHCGDQLSGVGGVARPGVVHRIDKDTTGLLVMAKDDATHQGLAAQFEKHTVLRSYNAICHGVPDASDPRLRGLRGISFEAGNTLKITTHLARHKTDRQRQAVLFDNGRHAVTRARVVQELAGGKAALVDCRLETGRTHQIRVHMAYAGHGLIGDQTYGNRRLKGVEFPRQALHAAELGFVHPITEEAMNFTAPLPNDMVGLLEVLSQ